MSETNPQPNPQTMTDERRRILKDFLDKKVLDIRIEDSAANPAPGAPDASSKIQEDRSAPALRAAEEPSRIIQANADGSLKPVVTPEPPKDTINFRAFPDGTYAKFTEIPQRPGFLAICLNTAKAGDPDVLNQVGIVKSRAVADMLCDGVNAMMQLRIMQNEIAAHASLREQEANETACELARMDGEGPQAAAPSVDQTSATTESAS